MALNNVNNNDDDNDNNINNQKQQKEQQKEQKNMTTSTITQTEYKIFFKAEIQPLTCEVIYQTRETVFHRDIQTPRRELKIRRAAEYF